MEYIFPNPEEKICLIQSKESAADVEAGEKLPNSSPLYNKIFEELEFSFHQSVIKLNQCARNLMNDSEGPNVLFLSNNEGCFAKCGLTIMEENNSTHYANLNYVDLVITEDNLKSGQLDIFSHELGHVMMSNILSNFPTSNSSKQHVSMGVTDYFMAFSEGWAIHFERLTHNSTPHYKELHDSKYTFDRDVLRLWLCESDNELRINGVLDNRYIHKKLLPQVDNLDLLDTIILEHTSTIFDKTKLKSAQEMLSCEGVLATLFYRISTNDILKNNYLSNSFYNNFLISHIDDEFDVKDLFSPFENVILKTFWVWYKIKDMLTQDSVPFIEFIKTWCECFPNDKQEILKLFILTTVGKTASNDLADLYEKAAYNGMVGNMDTLIENLTEFKEVFKKLCETIENGDVELDKNIGKEIWIENTHMKIPKYFWLNEEMVPLRINLNTASLYDLMSFPEIDLIRAKEILNAREEKGYFNSIEEVGIDNFI